jgi:hypothetical protein
MHMGIFYYVINLGLIILFSFFYMKKNWTEDKFEMYSNSNEKEKDT